MPKTKENAFFGFFGFFSAIFSFITGGQPKQQSNKREDGGKNPKNTFFAFFSSRASSQLKQPLTAAGSPLAIVQLRGV
jgi:hypothetical protein